MGDVLEFKTKDRCWRCDWNESVYLYFLEDKKRMVGLCCEYGKPELERCRALDLRIARKVFIPIGNGEYRRFSEANGADLQAYVEYLRDVAARKAKDAEISGGLLKEAKRLGIKRDEPLIPFLQEMAKHGWISDEGRRCLDYALANRL